MRRKEHCSRSLVPLIICLECFTGCVDEQPVVVIVVEVVDEPMYATV